MKEIIFIILLFLISCSQPDDNMQKVSEQGCDGQTYPEPAESPYALPYPAGQAYYTGLTNCSSSFHSPGNPDQYAFDFNMPLETPFVAARGGIVYDLVENVSPGSPDLAKSSIVGNYVIIDHRDSTYGVYLHSPYQGIHVEVNQEVQQGDTLGVTGQSGLAGYPHLHFIVVKAAPEYPYQGLAISFRNASPNHTVLLGNTEYTALDY